jgi:ADP-ribose pyrophosphatase YjhB (NUDIX family)
MQNKQIGVGVGVIIVDDNKILLGLRSSNADTADSELHGEGTWTLPGGGMNYGETFESTAIRETKEETNLDIDDIKVICIQNDKNEYAHYVSIGMVAGKHSGKLQTMEQAEIIMWKWFNLNDLPTNIFFPSKETIDSFKDGSFYKK